jgi:hypothetical protein
MWIFTKTGVLSIVQHDPTNGYADDGRARRDDTKVLVRARQAGHLVEAGFGEEEIISTPMNDYPFRVRALRVRVAEMVLALVMDINYENYKAEACKKLPYGMLSEVWFSAKIWLDEREKTDKSSDPWG